MRAESSFDPATATLCDSDRPHGSKISTKGGAQTSKWFRGGGDQTFLTSKYTLNPIPTETKTPTHVSTKRATRVVMNEPLKQ